MRSLFLPATLLCLSLTAAPLHADTIPPETLNFNDLGSYPPTTTYNVGSYGGLDFYMFQNVNPDSGGVVNPIPNDNTVAIFGQYYPFDTAPYDPLGLYTLPPPDGGDPINPADWPDFYTTDGSNFTLNSMLINPDTSGDPTYVLGYENGVLVDATTNDAADQATGLLTLNWTNINGVVFAYDTFTTNNDVFLDDVTVNEPITAPTPEPSTFLLVGSSLFGLLAAARRKARARL